MHFPDFLSSTQSAVSYTATGAEVILLIRLAWLGLIKEFKIFSAFLVFDAILTAALFGLDNRLDGYEWIWSITTPVWTLLLVGASLELMHGLVQPIPGETISRAAAIYGFLIGMTASVGLSMWAHPQAILRSSVLLTIILKRAVLSGCILAILSQGTILFCGEAPVMANWKLHRRVLLIFLAMIVASLYVQGRQAIDWSNLLCSITFLGCYCVWTVGFRRMFSDLYSWEGSGVPTNEQLGDILVYNRRHALAQRASTAAEKPSTV